MSEDTYTVRWLTGVTELKLVEHRLRWVSPDEFWVESDLMTMKGCDESMLPMVLSMMQPIKFLNERPAGMSEWKPWFAWRPVTLLTMEVAWLRWVVRRPTTGWHHFGETDGRWDYAKL